jgi:hypothetical protein
MLLMFVAGVVNVWWFRAVGDSRSFGGVLGVDSTVETVRN